MTEFGTKISDMTDSIEEFPDEAFVPFVVVPSEGSLSSGSNYRYAAGRYLAKLSTLAASAGSSLIGFIQAGTGAKARTVQTKLREIEVSLTDFENDDGTTPVGNGVMDCSTAWQRLLDFANEQVSAAIPTGYPIAKVKAVWPSGDWNIVTGGTLINANLVIEGRGRETSRIRIGADQYLLTITSTVYQLDIRGISTSGGLGVLAQTFTSVNVQGTFNIEENNFNSYTGVAIGSLASDSPYWYIKRNLFRGTVASKGVALAGARDMSEISENAFLTNLYHIKIANGANNVKIRDNDFIRFAAGGGAPALTDVWIVPHSVSTNSGFGCEITGNKFGNENLDPADYRILVADQGAGTNFLDKNHATTVSTGFWSGARVADNVVYGVGGVTHGFVYSYTPRVRFSHIECLSAGSKYPYAVEYDAGVSFAADNRLEDTNFFGWSAMDDGSETYTGPATNQPSAAIPIDPYGYMEAQSNSLKPWVSGSDVSFVDILTSNDMTTAATTNASIVGAADAIGGDNAVTATYATSSGEVRMTLSTGSITPGRLAWIEWDMMSAAAQAMDRIDVQLRTDASVIAFRRVLNIPGYWMTLRFPWVPRQNGTTLRLKFFPGAGAFSAGVTDQIKIGRPRVYHAHEPVNLVARYLEAKATFNPGDLAAGATETTTVTVDGAAAGDSAGASFSDISTANADKVTLAAKVSAANTVSVTFTNTHSANVNLAEATLRAWVRKTACP